MASLHVPFLTKDRLAAEAEAFLHENKLTEVPVDIELAAERGYSNIIPFSGLRREYGVDAFSASDLSAIYVDEGVYNQRPTRLRFSVAHELGHRVLHAKYIESLVFSNVEEWIDALGDVDRDDYDRMEFQANAFAGLVLMPKHHLESGFKEQLQKFAPQIQEAKAGGFTRDDYLDTLIYGIVDALLPQFEVSQEAMTIRITNSGMAEFIP